MKTTKNPTRSLLLLSAAMMLVHPPSARADIGLGDVLGTAWTIGNAVIGQVTLTPAYAIQSYMLRIKHRSPVSGADHSITKRVSKDLLGTYFYYTKISSSSSPIAESSDPFPVTTVNQLALICIHPAGGDVFIDTTVENHTEMIWMASVVQTGLFTSEGPWTVWLKTSGYPSHKNDCSLRTPITDYYYRASASIGKSGHAIVTLGRPNCFLNYPFYLASDFYK